MKKILPLLAVAALFAPSVAAQHWSVGAGAGPFVFGDFVERRFKVATPEGGPVQNVTLTVSAATRAGALIDIEREFADRWALRLEGSITDSELAVRDETLDDGVAIEAGDLSVVTLALPLVFRLNTRGAFRFHVRGGPAAAIYRIDTPATTPTSGETTETRTEYGLNLGGGVAWWLSDRFAIEGTISDTVTTSPFDEPAATVTQSTDVKRPHNVHTALGVRWRF
jgi:hypothetical protein